MWEDVRTVAECAQLCRDDATCATFLHNRYGRCHLRRAPSLWHTPVVPNFEEHSTISCVLLNRVSARDATHLQQHHVHAAQSLTSTAARHKSTAARHHEPYRHGEIALSAARGIRRTLFREKTVQRRLASVHAPSVPLEVWAPTSQPTRRLRDIYWVHVPKTATSFARTIFSYACGWVSSQRLGPQRFCRCSAEDPLSSSRGDRPASTSLPSTRSIPSSSRAIATAPVPSYRKVSAILGCTVCHHSHHHSHLRLRRRLACS